MSLIDPPVPTQQEILNQEVLKQKQQIQALWSLLNGAVVSIANFIYNCQIDDGTGTNTNFSAQDVFNVWGQNAVNLCQTTAATLNFLQQLININTPSGQTPIVLPAVPPSGYNITPNDDGTVTVTFGQSS